jgi:hypothetical protein
MPCGGIYPIRGSWIEELGNTKGECYFCGKNTHINDLFCEEWDCYLHKECVKPFLETKEGKIVLKHGHDISLD